MLNTKQWCHSERSEEPGLGYRIRFLASLGMTRLFGIQHVWTLMLYNAGMCTYAKSTTLAFIPRYQPKKQNWLWTNRPQLVLHDVWKYRSSAEKPIVPKAERLCTSLKSTNHQSTGAALQMLIFRTFCFQNFDLQFSVLIFVIAFCLLPISDPSP